MGVDLPFVGEPYYSGKHREKEEAMTHKFICPGCETEQPHAAALAEHAKTCEAYQDFASYMDTCDYCSELITDEDAVDWCDRRGEHQHTECHSESGCLCRP